MIEEKIYLNRPQVLSATIDANQEYFVGGRGLGKSSYILGLKSLRLMQDMPRSCIVEVAETYKQLLTRTLPARIEGWERLGFKLDVDYVVGKRGPKHWDLPLQPPMKFDHFIHTRWGSGIHMVSQDVKGSAVGLNTVAALGDEAKLLDYEKFMEEVWPTLRAQFNQYGHLHNYRSVTFTTSMPTLADDQWILKKEQEMDVAEISLLKGYAYKIMTLQRELATANKTRKKFIKTEMNKLLMKMNPVRKDAVFYHEGTSLDNIVNLGKDYIKRMKRDLPDFIFRTEILNERPDRLEGGFYPSLNKAMHLYGRKFNNSLLQGLEYNLEKAKDENSLIDEDCVMGERLRIAVDWGTQISCLPVAQDLGNEYRFINEFYVKVDEVTEQSMVAIDMLAQKFHNYYRHHSPKEVFFIKDKLWGDNRTPIAKQTFNERFESTLRKLGWSVYMHTIDYNYTPHSIYYLWEVYLTGGGTRKIQFNKHNCKYTITSMMGAPVKQTSKGIAKDKKSEKSGSKVAQEEATHFSDATDLHILSIGSDVLQNHSGDLMTAS